MMHEKSCLFFPNSRKTLTFALLQFTAWEFVRFAPDAPEMLPRRALCHRNVTESRRLRTGLGRGSRLGGIVLHRAPELAVLRLDVGIELTGEVRRQLQGADDFLHVAEVLQTSRIRHTRREFQLNELG